eukprot:3931964-Rhodomonas_salina.1
MVALHASLGPSIAPCHDGRARPTALPRTANKPRLLRRALRTSLAARLSRGLAAVLAVSRRPFVANGHASLLVTRAQGRQPELAGAARPEEWLERSELKKASR